MTWVKMRTKGAITFEGVSEDELAEDDTVGVPALEINARTMTDDADCTLFRFVTYDAIVVTLHEEEAESMVVEAPREQWP